MDKSKLIELRKKKIANKKTAEDKKHSELLDALSSLSNALSDEPLKLESIQKILNELSEVSLFNKQMLDLYNSLKDSLDKEVSISEMTKLLTEVAKGDVAPVVNAIKNLSNAVLENKSQAPEDYIPVRRVRRVGKEYVFDDDSSTPVVSVSGSGGGGIQLSLTRNNTTSLAVVNPDGTPIAGSSGGGYEVVGLKDDTDTRINPATADIQTSGQQRTMIVNGDNTPVETKPVQDGLDGTEEALITHSVIQGYSTGGGGQYHDIKVTPSGALTVEADIQNEVDVNITNPTYIIRNISTPTDPEIDTYKYFGFEDINTGSWRIMRKTLSNNVFMYDTGASDYHTAWTNKSGGIYL